MDDLVQRLTEQLTGIGGWEALAMLLGVLYLILAMRQSIWCWYAAFGSTVIYTVIFWQGYLHMESALNAYYMIMAIYGWHSWRASAGGQANAASSLPISRWSLQRHGLAIAAVAALTLLSEFLLEQHTQSPRPYLDSFTTWGAVITTYMVARKVLENWLYWLVVDSAAMYLFIDRGYYFTSVLMGIYLVLVVFGWFSWRREWQAQSRCSSGL